MAKNSKTKSKQIFSTLSTQGINPKSLLPPNASAAAATPETTMDTSSDPPLPSNTLPSTTSMAAQPSCSDEDEDDSSSSDSSEGSSSDSGDGSGSDSSEGSGSDSGNGSGSDNGNPSLRRKKHKVTDIEFTLPDLIKRSNNGEPINIIPKPNGTGGHDFNIHTHMGLADDKSSLGILALIQQCLKNSPAQARARARKHATCTHVTLQVQPQVAGAITAPLAAALIAPIKNKNNKGKQVNKENPKEILPYMPVPVSVSLTMSKKSIKKTKKKALHASSDVQDSAASPVASVCF
ncbi:hypothetical protein JB92DRAFT_3036061 [Gautieria morchelliformis]|nr:hypothetical protein JB92DRAFT_3036061 [Gautieria morchelliformis]